MKTLLFAPSFEDLIRLLRAWRLWLLASLLGALAGMLIYAVHPPEYRARATVVVSFNMEEAWPDKPDNELFYYLEREARKVEAVAWADATLTPVAQASGLTISVLRGGKLQLSHPQDGGWHFYASDPSADVSAALVGVWAESFVSQVRQGIQTAVELDAARQALILAPADTQLQDAIQELQANSLAITPELQISLSQGKDLPVERTGGLGTYALAGGVIAQALAALLILFFVKPFAPPSVRQ